MMSQEIERLNLTLRNKHEESEAFRKQFRELEIKVTNIYEVESNRKYAAYEQNIANLTRENEDMRRKLSELV